MVLSIREDAKTIANELLKEAVHNGDLYQKIKISKNQFAQKSGFTSDNDKKHFWICFQYLDGKGLIHYSIEGEDVCHIQLTADMIDFLSDD